MQLKSIDGYLPDYQFQLAMLDEVQTHRAARRLKRRDEAYALASIQRARVQAKLASAIVYSMHTRCDLR
jgi:hypothetical protein